MAIEGKYQIMPSVMETFSVPFLQEKGYVKRYENGYQLFYVPKRGQVFNINTWVNTGSIHEDAVNNGVSHFLEHLLFKGTERFAPGEFDKAMEGMGAVINAATWKDFTFYYITGPKGSENQNFVKALDMHADMLLFSTVPPEELGETFDIENPAPNVNKRERGVVIEEIGMRGDQPWTKVFNGLNHLMYPDSHPYKPDVIGTREIIATIPRESILDYYWRWYSPHSLYTIVVGDFDWEWLQAEVEKAFKFETSPAMKATNKLPVRQIQPQDDLSQYAPSEKLQVIQGDVQTGFMMLGFHGPYANNLKESIAFDVIGKILGEGRSSRLYQAFIEKPESPVFNMISAGQSQYRLGNVMYVQGNLLAEQGWPQVEQQIEAVKNELGQILGDKPITQDELNRAKKNLKISFAEISETAAGIAEEIGESLILMGSADGYTHYLEALDALTLDDVQAVAKKWLTPEKACTSVLIPKVA